MIGFEKVKREVLAFKESRLYPVKYNDLIEILRSRPEMRRLVLSAELERDMKLGGTQIREIVKNARRLGVPIASCGDGYYYARNFKELESTIHHIKERRDSLTFTLNALEKCYPDQNQTALNFDQGGK